MFSIWSYHRDKAVTKEKIPLKAFARSFNKIREGDKLKCERSWVETELRSDSMEWLTCPPSFFQFLLHQVRAHLNNSRFSLLLSPNWYSIQSVYLGFVQVIFMIQHKKISWELNRLNCLKLVQNVCANSDAMRKEKFFISNFKMHRNHVFKLFWSWGRKLVRAMTTGNCRALIRKKSCVRKNELIKDLAFCTIL